MSMERIEKGIIRIRSRRTGKYEKYPRCENCGKPVAPDKYYSLEDCNETGVGVVLHKECIAKFTKKRKP